MEAEHRLCLSFLELHPREAARMFEKLEVEEGVLLLEMVGDAGAAGLLSVMAPVSAAAPLNALDRARAGAVLSALQPEIAVQLLRRLGRNERDALLALVPEGSSRPLRRKLTYAEGTAGFLMDPVVPAFREDLSEVDALARIRRPPPRRTTTST